MMASFEFFKEHRKLLALSFVLAALGVFVSPSFAQSLDTSAFEAAIMSGMQIFFDNLPSFVLLGFAVFGIIFAFGGGLAFAQNLLQKILSVFTKS